MKAAELLARDLVLRVFASDGEFRRDWLARGAVPKRVVPLAVAPGATPELAAAITGAATEMGATRLLACRIRTAFMYDTVTVLPVSAKSLLQLAAHWGEPEDFLVCLPDGSAAVLVSVAGYALAAGPPPFLAALAGPDVAGTRQRFTAWASENGDPRLRLVAARHGSSPASRHAPRRSLRPDLAERLSGWAAAVRQRHALTAALRVLRAAVGWGAVAVIVITVASAPRASHALPALAGAIWLLLQVFILARTHTLGWAACMRMMAAGAVCAVVFAAVAWHAVGPAALHVSRAWIGPAAEAAKLVPIGVFWLLARNRFTRLAAVDYLLLGVASGAGFGLAANTAAALARPGAGWHMAAVFPGWTDAGAIRFPGDAVTTGLAAAGIGLAVAAVNQTRARRRVRGWLAWVIAPVLACVAVLDHYHYGAVATGVTVPAWVSRLHAAMGNGHASRLLLLAVIAAAMAVDFGAQRRVADLVPPVPGVPLWAPLAREARGAEIRARLRWSARTVRGRLARRQAGLRAGVTEAVVTAAHEVSFLLVAVRPRRPRGVFAASLAFTRERRELAMREAGAAGRVRRDTPRRESLWTAWQRLVAVLGLGGTASLVIPAVLPGITPLPAHAARAAAYGAVPAVGAARNAMAAHPAGAADLVGTVRALHAWFSQFVTAGQVLIVAAGLGVLLLLSSGWSFPVPLARGRAADETTRLLRVLAAVPAPGRFVFGLFAFSGELLPPDTVRLLQGERVARPYQRAPAAPREISPPGLRRATPQAAPAEPRGPAKHGSANGGELHRSGWLFPQERVKRWLGHAEEFGVEATPAGATPDGGSPGADPTAQLTEALRRIAEAAESLRFDAITFRNRPARAVLDRATGGAVFFTPAGEFTGCAVLTEEQIFRLVTELKL